MSFISKEEQALTRAADLVRSARSDLTGQINGLPGRLATAGTWEGGGAQGFTNLITAWNTETDKIVRALDEFESGLTGAETNYTQVDDVQLETYQNINSRMTTQA